MTSKTICNGEIEIEGVDSSYWKIDSFVEKIRQDGTILSPAFQMGSHDPEPSWQFQLTLIKESPNDEYYVNCKLKYLKKINGYVEIIFFKFDEAHNEQVGFDSLFVFNNSCFSSTDVQLHGAKFIEKDYCRYRKIFLSRYLKIPFTFHDCEYRLAKHLSDDEESDSESESQRIKAMNLYETLMDNKEYSDCTITTNGKSFHAHKCILALKSSVFAKMFSNDMLEKQTSTVDIEDIEYEILQEMLRFMYSGRVKKFNKIAADLLYAANKYDIEPLKSMCIERLIKNINADNAIGYIELADIYNNEKLKSTAVEFVVENIKDVINKAEFEELSKKNPIFFQIFKAVALKDK